MAAADKDVPEMPDNWREYSRMLGDLPMRPLPPGADGRLQARLASEIASPRPRRPWLAGSLTLAAGALSIIAGVLVFSPEQATEPPVTVRPAVVTDEKPRARRPRRKEVERPIAPQIGESPKFVDTVPNEIPIPSRHPEATTGGRVAPATPGAASRPQHRTNTP